LNKPTLQASVNDLNREYKHIIRILKEYNVQCNIIKIRVGKDRHEACKHLLPLDVQTVAEPFSGSLEVMKHVDKGWNE
jgi:hypothetical protein